jgi:hypothetical protein
MTFNNIIGEIEKIDPEVFDRLNTRRTAMKGFRNWSGKLALAAVPLAIGSMFNKAYAGATSTKEAVIEVLKYALVLEYLEAAFYVKGLAETAIPAGAARTAIQTISNHETAHVAFLKGAITSMSVTPANPPTFDFTARGAFPTVFSDYNTFLAVAQTFEDTGVRAYKGRAAELVKGGDLLTAALNIHSVEARHAAHIRYMRRALTASVNVKPWITLEVSGVGAAVNASYAGEANTKQANIEIVNINGMAINAEAASEAFDEGLTKDQVLAIIGPFIV